MPRLPSVVCRLAAARFNRINTVFWTTVLATGVYANPPEPRIDVLGTPGGMAPFTVHVHATESEVGEGNMLTARFEWDFGDPDGRYNKLVGWNAAHVYDDPGHYQVKLRITNELGQRATKTVTIHVTGADRETIYVSPGGNDNWPGTRAAPIRTAARAAQMIDHNTTVRFRRNGTYPITSTIVINKQNVVLSAYDPGNDPVLKRIGASGNTGIIDMGGNARNVLIEDIEFDSDQPPTTYGVRGIRPNGRNITIRDCHFDDISYAINCELRVTGLLAQNNDTRVIGAYFAWVIGTDHVYVGNTVAGSVDEHNIRLGGAERTLIAHNDLTNTVKTTIWAMIGRYCYITENTLRHGRVIVGPNYAVGQPGERFRYAVADSNLVLNEGFILYSGAENVMLRNNIVRANANTAFSVWGWYEPMQRTVRNVRILHNTVSNSHSLYGRFLKLGDDVDDVRVSNNLYCATHLNSSNGAGNVISDDDSLAGHLFRSNLWSNPAGGNICHFLSYNGVGAAQWNGYSQTTLERYRSFDANDLDGDYEPTFNADSASTCRGVHVDFYGRQRPLNGSRTYGAVEQ